MAVAYYGDFLEDSTVYIPFNTFTSDDPSASCTITDLVDADIKVHKDGSTDEIVTDGATVAINFDGVTGNHLITIDTSADAAYAIGSDYMVRINGTTIDGATINAWVGLFSIENRFKEVTVTSMASNVITGASLHADACTKIIDDFETQSQADPTGFHVNVKEVNGTSQTANDNGADINEILTDTGSTLDTLIKDIPTVAEFEARSLPSADYTIVADLGTVQSGDSYAIVNGDHGLVSIQDDVDEILTDTGTTLDTLIKDIPTTAEFEARTIPSADYVVVGDTLARVTLVDTCTTNTDMDGAAASIDAVLTDTNELQTDDYPTTIAAIQTTVDSILEDTDGTHGVAIAAASLDAIWDRTEALTGDTNSYETMLTRLYRFFNNKLKVTDATGAAALRNEADNADIATGGITDDDTTTIRTALTWV